MRHTAVILTYHALADCPAEDDPHNLCVAPEVFAAQIARLATTNAIVPLDEAMEDGSGRGKVALTFDDAYRSVLSVAAPILAERGVPATVFVPTMWLGRVNGWDEPGTAPFQIMTREELVEVQAHGLTVESHGHAHIDMAVEDPAVVRADIEESLGLLEEITKRRPRYLAYPYGRYSKASQEVVASLGMAGALSIDSTEDGRWARAREQVTRHDGSFMFRMKSAGLYGPIRRSRFGKAAYAATRPLARRLLLHRG